MHMKMLICSTDRHHANRHPTRARRDRLGPLRVGWLKIRHRHSDLCWFRRSRCCQVTQVCVREESREESPAQSHDMAAMNQKYTRGDCVSDVLPGVSSSSVGGPTLCKCGIDLAACGACGQGWAQRKSNDLDKTPLTQTSLEPSRMDAPEPVEGPEVWFQVMRPLRLGLGVQVGWHYSKTQLLERLSVPGDGNDATSELDAKRTLLLYMTDPKFLRRIHNEEWSSWPFPQAEDGPDRPAVMEFGQRPEELVILMLILSYAPLNEYADTLDEAGYDSEEVPEACYGGLRRSEVDAQRSTVNMLLSDIRKLSARAGFEPRINDATETQMRHLLFNSVSTLMETLDDKQWNERVRRWV